MTSMESAFDASLNFNEQQNQSVSVNLKSEFI